MASMVPENWGYVDGHDGLEDTEFSQINYNLLMSLLDETQIDNCDDEKLKKVIRSLEAEISFDGLYEFDNTMVESDLIDCQSSIHEPASQDDHLMQLDDLDYWIDVETMPTSPSDGMTSWYVDSHGQGMVSNGVNEFSWDQEQDYCSLWKETNVTM